tara:strand:+ start:12052 stop:12732 length:681 start_codon:yes stop_codon:yes gene_type:complete
MGTVSFGLALVVAPVLLIFLEPHSVVIIANLLIVILLTMVFVKVRQHLQMSKLYGMLSGGLCAVPIGVFALKIANPSILRILIGILILTLGFSLLFKSEIPLAKFKRSGFFFGFIGSLSITALSIGGPVAAAYVIAQKQSPDSMRASLSFFFITTYAFAFILYFFTGLIDIESVINTAVLVPGLIAGFLVANLIVNRINASTFRYIAIGLILIGGTVLLLREILRL